MKIFHHFQPAITGHAPNVIVKGVLLHCKRLPFMR